MKSQKNNQYEANRRKKMILVMLMLGLLFVNLSLIFVSAESDKKINPVYLNDSQEESGTATSYKAIPVEGATYPKIELYEWSILGILDKKIAEVELTDNSDTCITDCYAIMKVTLYKNKKNFFNDVIFQKKIGYGEAQPTDEDFGYKIYLEQVTNKKKLISNDTAFNCESYFNKNKPKNSDEIDTNFNLTRDCAIGYVASYENITETSWEEYQPEKVLQHGVYYFKITGQKKAYESVDWIPELFDYPIEELAWWNSADPFGDGSLGDIVFTTTTKSYGNMVLNVDYQVGGNTLYLYTDKAYKFNNFELGVGTTLTTTNTSGVAMWIEVANLAKINGAVNLNNIHSLGQSNENLTIYGNVINIPGVTNGGSGGATSYFYYHAGGGQSNGYGGGGAGGDVYPYAGNGQGSDGGSGGVTPANGAGASCTGGTNYANGQAGSQSRGGGAGCRKTSTATSSTGGSGGASHSNNGGNGAGVKGSGAWVMSGGGGGSGGLPGKTGYHFYLASQTINFTGTITTSGTNGGNGGNGGNAYMSGSGDAGGGGGAGGGGAGNAGNISFVYETLYDTGTKNMLKGTSGTGGTGGSPVGAGPSGVNGNTGSTGINGTFTTNQIDLAIDITLNSPPNGESINLNNNVTFNCSSAIGGGKNITNMTLYINSVAHYTNASINKPNGTLVHTNNITSYGTQFWTCDAWTSSGDYNIAPERYIITRPYTQTSESHQNSTYETSPENFSIQVTYNDTIYSDVNGFLYYDGNSYTSDKQKFGNTASFYSTANIPLVTSGSSQNKTFYWQFQFAEAGTGTIINVTSDIYQQLVNKITLQICNGTYNITALQFTIKDELNASVINASLQATFMKYYLAGGDGSVSRNYSYQNLAENQSVYSFCISPSEKSYKVDMLASYSKTGYSPRTKYLTGATLSNVSNNQTLYLLDDTNAVKFFVTINLGGFPLQMGYSTITKYMIGTGVYETIGVRQTDSTGKFIEYMELDQLYRFSITDSSGNFLGTIERRAICETTPCEITLDINTETLEGRPDTTFDSFYDTFGTNVTYSLNYNRTSKMVDFIFTDLTGTANYFRLYAHYISGNITGGSICDTYVYSTAGSITCNLTNIYGDVRVDTYVSRSPEKFVGYIIISLRELGDVLGKDGIIIALLLIITLSAIGMWNPPVGISLAVLACLGLNLMGIMSLSLGTISLLFILGIIIIWKMRS